MGSETSTIRERLVARRAAPFVLLLDRFGALRASSGDGNELWDRYGRAIGTLISIHRPELDGGEPVATVTPDGTHTLRIAPLSPDEGYAVLLEPFKSRDPVSDLGERFSLTRRECEVARLLLEGASTEEIAGALSIARSTAVIHVKSIIAKTGSRTRTAAVGRIVHQDGDGLEIR